MHAVDHRNAAKIHGDSLVNGFGLPIALVMERRAHVELDADALEKVPPNIACEDGVYR